MNVKQTSSINDTKHEVEYEEKVDVKISFPCKKAESLTASHDPTFIFLR